MSGKDETVSVCYGILCIPSEIACFSLVRCRILEKIEVDEHKYFDAEKGRPSDWEHVELSWTSSGNAARFRKGYLQNRDKIDAYLQGRDISTLTKQEVHMLMQD